ncbi:Protein of unknown function [Bacillus cereus]
MNGPF